MRLRPPKPYTEMVVAVWAVGDRLYVCLEEKDERLRTLVKSRGFHFDYDAMAWTRLLAQRHGPALDRAAETAHLLLHAGFPVEVSEEIAGLILASSYQPEIRRWVTLCVSAPHKGWLALEWGRDEDFWNKAWRIRGSRYHKPFVVLPPEQYEEVEDFAEAHGFTISDAARQAMDEAAARRRAALIVDIPLPPAQPRQTPAAPAYGVVPELADDLAE